MMPEPKHYLKALYRSGAGETPRGDFLRLDMNENPEGLPEHFVKQMLGKVSGKYLSSYPEYRSLMGRIANHCGLCAENICLANGSDAAIKYLFETYVSPGDKVVMTDPTFAMYPVYCQMFQAECVSVAYGEDFCLPLDQFMNAIGEGARMAVLVNPNNPVGSLLARDDLLAVAKACQARDVLLVVDEAYFYFCDVTVIDWVPRFSNLVVLRTFSKLCGLAALRLGYAAANPTVIDHLNKVKPTFDVNGLAVCAAEALLDRTDIMAESIDSINAGRSYLRQRLIQSGVLFREGAANFFLIRCSKPPETIVRRLAERGILVAGGFKQDFLKDYIRVTIGGIESMRRFADAFLSIGASPVLAPTSN